MREVHPDRQDHLEREESQDDPDLVDLLDHLAQQARGEHKEKGANLDLLAQMEDLVPRDQEDR